MTKRTLTTAILAVALLATPRLASAGVHFSFGIGLPFFGAVVAPAPAVVVPAPAYLPPPAYYPYPYPYPPVVAYGPPGYYGGSVISVGPSPRSRVAWEPAQAVPIDPPPPRPSTGWRLRRRTTIRPPRPSVTLVDPKRGDPGETHPVDWWSATITSAGRRQLLLPVGAVL